VFVPVWLMREKNGKRLGRPPTASLNPKQVRQLFLAGIRKASIARQLQIGCTSVCRILKERNRPHG